MAEQQIRASMFDIDSRTQPALRFLSILTTLLTIFPSAQAQTLTVLHNFNEADGAEPYAGVTIDQAGNLYGTTTIANNSGGTVFKLSHVRGGWVLNTLHAFVNSGDGSYPTSRVVFGPDGALYGTTYYGGTGACRSGCGTVYTLRPGVTFCRSVSCPWDEQVIYSFTGNDGQNPYLGDLVFDQAGNIYGTTLGGGARGMGVVYKLTRSGNNWTESVLHDFTGGDDGAYPQNGVALDPAGNVYGTATYGGSYAYGTVYELSPSGSGWTESTLYSFSGDSDNEYPIGSVAIDSHGYVYGTTNPANSLGGGTVWELTSSGGGWGLAKTQLLAGYEGPFDTPTLDAAGNVYGTSLFTGAGSGEVFKLTPSGGGWSYTSVSFNGNNGEGPIGGVTLDTNGNLYGTTAGGGTGHGQQCGGCGVVWEIAP